MSLLKKADKPLVGEGLVGSSVKMLFNLFLVVPIALGVILPISLLTGLLGKIFCFWKGRKSRNSVGETNYELPEVNSEKSIPLGERKYDVVVYGATGYTGKFAVKHLAETYGTKVNWAIAGRRKSALEKIKADLCKIDSELEHHIDIIIADSFDEPTLENLVHNTKVVCTTAGPFTKYGIPVVKYCVAYGTSYCDITGEADFVRDMVSRYDAKARENGAYIVHFCGHDSIPWDLLTVALSQKIKKENDDEELVKITIGDRHVGGFSGGTFDTMLMMRDKGMQSAKRMAFDPLYTNTKGEKADNKVLNKSRLLPGYESEQKEWGSFFVMSPLNGMAVARTNAILNMGKEIIYHEYKVYPNLPAVINEFISLVVVGLVVSSSFLSKLALELGALPKPGQGPSEEMLAKSFLKTEGYATGSNGTKVKGSIHFVNDAGYQDTGVMLIECGLCIALDREDIADVSLTGGGGVLTPGSAIGMQLLKRLTENSECIVDV